MAQDQEQLTTIEKALAGLPPDFAFFADRFRTQICPKLEAREADRIAAVKRQRNFGIAAVAVFALFTGFGFFFFHHPFGAFLGGVSAFGLYSWGSAKLNALGRETKEMLVEPVCHEFGMTFEVSPLDPADIMTFRNLKLVPHWDRARYEDRLTGQRQNAPFEFFEAHLEEKHETSSRNGRRTEWVTVFRGQCLVARFPKPFNGVTRVVRDQGAFNFLSKLGEDLPRVKLEDPVFEKAFEVYGSDQIEARFILTPDFMERLLSLEKTFEGKKLRCAFSGGEMYLCVEGKNLFEPGSMYRRMDDLSRVREMLTDFAAVFLLIDSMVERRTPEALRT
ncbi:MAG: DUF3137 domain-containing protein [Alphaproteobacteria bacterium]|nr:DUF3137 domain-containing protein [Alphaproteobacteria bacterium]